MKRINEYRKLLEVSQETDLSGLKSTYRSLMKEWHPDKFANDEEAKEEAEHKSKKIIEAYHFLVSIAPETQASNLEIYNQTINESGIVDFWHKGQTLTVNFQDGSVYEYLGVPKNTYVKMVNASSYMRFAKRHIFTSFIYRNVSKQSA